MEIVIMKRMLLTGANRGIGRALCEALLKRGGFDLTLTTRSDEKGSELKKQLEKDGLKRFDLGVVELESDESIKKFVKSLKKPYDVVYLNAGLNLRKSEALKSGMVEKVLRVNFGSHLSLIEGLVNEKLINKGGKLIQVSSELGSFRNLRSEPLRKQLLEAKTLGDLKNAEKEYLQRVAKGEAIFSPREILPHYAFSKLLINLSADIIAKDPRIVALGVESQTCDPGWVQTDMGGAEATLTTAQALPNIIQQITLPQDKANQGKMFSNGKFVEVKG